MTIIHGPSTTATPEPAREPKHTTSLLSGDSRKWGVMVIDPALIVSMLSRPMYTLDDDGTFRKTTVSGLPADAKVVRVQVNENGDIEMIVESKELRPIPPDARAPKLPITLRSQVLDDVGDIVTLIDMAER